MNNRDRIFDNIVPLFSVTGVVVGVSKISGGDTASKSIERLQNGDPTLKNVTIYDKYSNDIITTTSINVATTPVDEIVNALERTTCRLDSIWFCNIGSEYLRIISAMRVMRYQPLGFNHFLKDNVTTSAMHASSHTASSTTSPVIRHTIEAILELLKWWKKPMYEVSIIGEGMNVDTLHVIIEALKYIKYPIRFMRVVSRRFSNADTTIFQKMKSIHFGNRVILQQTNLFL